MIVPRAAGALICFLVAAIAPLAGQGIGPSTGGAVALEHERRMLGHHKRVLMIAAHPDDENTEVLTILTRGHGAETAYLSLTRGEGGQNLIGAELGDGLGLIRSGELLAARALDGGQQFFTRAADYGFSKDIAEAWRKWPRDSVLKDVVRVVRRFRPQVIISVFSGTPLDGHGHHQAAGWLAAEAFRVAGDPGVFPELEREEGLAPVTPLKLYRSSRFDAGAPMAELDGGVLDAVVGQSFRQVAMRSRSLHRSQNMGALQEIGPSTARLQLLEDRTGAGASFWDGIDTREVPGDPDQAARRARVHAIEAGLILDAIALDDRIVPGQRVTLRLSAWNAGHAPVEVAPSLAMDGAADWEPDGACLGRPVVVRPNSVEHCQVSVRVPARHRYTIPYFLETERTGSVYAALGPPEVRGLPFEPEPVRAAFTVRVAGGEPFRLELPATFRFRDQVLGEVRRPVQIVPRVGVRLEPSAGVWARNGGARTLTVTLQHGAPDTTRGVVRVEVPAGWSVTPAQAFLLSRPEEAARFAFRVTPGASAAPGRYEVRAIARADEGQEFGLGVEVIDYPHITSRLLPSRPVTTVHLADLALPAVARVGYVRGAADRVPESLREAGLAVDLLDRAVLERGDFSAWDVIVIGPRAFETDTALVEHGMRLVDWVRRGGRLVVQYQQHAYFTGGQLPLPMALPPRGHDRVTDAAAVVTVLKPDAPPFSGPNRITAADWDGWVQERGLYFARSWDPGWAEFMALSDPGEPPLRGGLLAARVGQGTYIYTGLSFFRQLPAAVPGALRLFLNLLEYNHPPPTP
jgi:LmbE family N-acetylglucosaminyl deacetylase